MYRQGSFKPILEDDWIAMLYAKLVDGLANATKVHVKTRIEGHNSKWDLVLGPVASGYYVVPQLVAEIKFVASAFSDQQCLHTFGEARDRDVRKLSAVRPQCEFCTLLIFDETDWFRRSRFRETGLSRLETLVQLTAECGIGIQHYPLTLHRSVRELREEV